MKWAYFVRQKTRMAVAAAVVLLLLIFTHLIDKSQFADLHHSATSVYEDRLLAQGYIYDIADHLTKKRIALYQGIIEETSFNDQIIQLLSDLEATSLTREESSLLSDVIQEFNALMIKERHSLTGDSMINHRSVEILQQQHSLLNEKLSRLSKIQMQEGEKLMTSSDNVKALNYLNSQTEIAILIIAGLCVQVLIFAQRSFTPRFQQHPRLN